MSCRGSRGGARLYNEGKNAKQGQETEECLVQQADMNDLQALPGHRHGLWLWAVPEAWLEVMGSGTTQG